MKTLIFSSQKNFDTETINVAVTFLEKHNKIFS